MTVSVYGKSRPQKNQKNARIYLETTLPYNKNI